MIRRHTDPADKAHHHVIAAPQINADRRVRRAAQE